MTQRVPTTTAQPTTPDADAAPAARRRALGMAMGSLALAACGGGGGSAGTSSTGGSSNSSGTTPSTDATLSALVLSSGTLSPAFAAGTTAYAVTVSNTVSTITVTPTTTASGATVKVNGLAVASGSASTAISLSEGSSNVLSIEVTAADGLTTRSYTVTATRSAAGSCTLTATETQGPYPLLAILSNSAMVRSDIREGKTGVPLTVNLSIQDLSAGCTPVSGAAVYIWHCDKDGLYSGYNVSNNTGQTGLTYLRGIQVTDANGAVSFTTIYPGWYAGRITHIHVQIYLNNNLAVTATATTQIAFPQSVTQAVYATALYTKGQNTSVTSFAADNVFSDGTSTEMAVVTGDAVNGYVAGLTVVVA